MNDMKNSQRLTSNVTRSGSRIHFSCFWYHVLNFLFCFFWSHFEFFSESSAILLDLRYMMGKVRRRIAYFSPPS
jgi:hypothetical protein